MLRAWKTLILVSGILLSFSGYAGVADCRNEWAHPSFQTMSMDSAISFALTDYKNGERHFSVKQSSGQGVEIYYLKGAVLVKGYSQAQIEQFPQNGLFMMPMTFAVPIAILAEIAPNGPCNIEAKTPVSTQLSGAMRLQDRKLTGAVGQLAPSALSEVSYELDVSIDPPAPNKKSVRYSGAMSFAPQQESLPEDTDITGYLVVTRSRPFPVAGNSGVPVKLGDLKRFLVSGQIVSKPAP
ncbi:MAG: hypothetical protein PHD65_09775 [Gallionella sp.]|nr:hypothetical protein [Gallionella sp.]